MATFFELGLESQLGNKNQLVKINKLIIGITRVFEEDS